MHSTRIHILSYVMLDFYYNIIRSSYLDAYNVQFNIKSTSFTSYYFYKLLQKLF